MMARDSAGHPPPQPLSPGVVEALRAAILRRTEAEELPDEDLHRALHDVAAEARARDMRAEDLVIAFKALLDEIPQPVSAAGRLRHARFRERLVTLCIRAYYAR